VAAVATTVKALWPAAVGDPDSTPAAVNDRPGGRAPSVTAKENGPAEPAAVSWTLYGVPTVPPGSVGGVIVIAGQEMLSVYPRVPVQAFSSVAVTKKVAVVAAAGVPERTPPEESVRPAGSAPLWSVNVYGAVPPDAVMVWL
jgi:hypothetical protein